MTEMTDTEWSDQQMRDRFKQLEKESRQGGRMRRRVDFTTDEEARIIAFRDNWLKTHNNSTYRMWDAMVKEFPNKSKDNLRFHWDRKLSKSSAVETSSAVASSAVASSAAAVEPPKAVSKAVSKKVVVKKLAVKKSAAVKVSRSVCLAKFV